MRIARITHIGLEHRPVANERYGSGQAMIDARQASIIKLETDDGIVGIGDARGPVGMIRAALNIIAPHLLGRDTNEVAHVWAELVNRLYHVTADRLIRAAFSGIDIALHDAVARGHGISVAELLGGSPVTSVVPYATCGYLTEDGLVGLARQLRALPPGVGAAKIKIGLNPADDQRRVDLARQLLDPSLPLMVDANANYSADLARASMDRVREYDIEWYEEPVPPWDVTGYAWLHDHAGMPIAAGEAHASAREFGALISANAIDIVQPNLCSVGGIREATTVADLARMHNKRTVAAVWDSGVGLAAALQWSRSLTPSASSAQPPRPQWVEYDVVGSPLRDEILREPIALNDGVLEAPGRIGLGVELDDAAVAGHTVLAAQSWTR